MSDVSVISIGLNETMIKAVSKFAWRIPKDGGISRPNLTYIEIKQHPIGGLTFTAINGSVCVIARYPDGFMMTGDQKPLPKNDSVGITAYMSTGSTLIARLKNDVVFSKGVRLVSFYRCIENGKPYYLNRSPEDPPFNYPFPDINNVMINDPMQMRAECKADRVALIDRRLLGLLSERLIPKWDTSPNPLSGLDGATQGVEFYSSPDDSTYAKSIHYIVSNDNHLLIGIMPLRREE